MSLLITPSISPMPMCPCVSRYWSAGDGGCCWYLPVAAQSSSVTVPQLHQYGGLVCRFTRQHLLERLPAALSDWSKMTADHTCCFEHLKKTPSASGSNLCRRVFFPLNNVWGCTDVLNIGFTTTSFKFLLHDREAGPTGVHFENKIKVPRVRQKKKVDCNLSCIFWETYINIVWKYLVKGNW